MQKFTNAKSSTDKVKKISNKSQNNGSASTYIQVYDFRFDLDQLDTADKYPDHFSVMLDIAVSKNQRPSKSALPWTTFDASKSSPNVLFSSKDEMVETVKNYGMKMSDIN